MVSLSITIANNCEIVCVSVYTSAKIRFKLLLAWLYLLKKTSGMFSGLFYNTHVKCRFFFKAKNADVSAFSEDRLDNKSVKASEQQRSEYFQ